MQAKVQKTKQEIQFISDPKQIAAAEAGELKVGKKTVLIIKGLHTETMLGQVFMRFLNETDSVGKPFEFSRKFRFLAHSDPVFHNRTKVTSAQFEEYLSQYFQFAEKVTNAATGETLLLVDKLPKFFSALASQSRYIGKYAQMWELTD
jgi:hypothetical protein